MRFISLFQSDAFCNATNPIAAFRCRSGLTFSDPDECTRFYLCIGDEEVVLATCPNGYHYSKQFATCLPPEDADCEDGAYIPSVQKEKTCQCFTRTQFISFFTLERSGLLSQNTSHQNKAISHVFVACKSVSKERK